MGLFSSSSSKSESEAIDGRSAASDQALAAGANRGSVVYYTPGGKVFERPANIRPLLLAAGIALVLWKGPKILKMAKKLKFNKLRK
jgi:hypothetical protein